MVDGAGVSASQLLALKDRIAVTKAKLEAAQYAGITKEDMSGDLLYSAVLSYFSATGISSAVAARTAGIIEYRKPSFGNFFAAAQPAYWYGIAKQVSFPGLSMDIDRYVTMASAKDNNTDNRISHIRQSGQMLSAYEHLVPEKLFTDTQHPGEAVSAVKALGIASAQGQKIYRITAANVGAMLPQLAISLDVKTEIQNAIAAGKEASVSQANVTVNGWTGVGYIVEDPTTGAAAYKISGGANGGWVQTVLGSVAVVAGFALLAFGGPLFLFALYYIFGMALLLVQIENLSTGSAVGAAGTFFGILALAAMFPAILPIGLAIQLVLAILGVVLSIIGQTLSRLDHRVFRVYA